MSALKDILFGSGGSQNSTSTSTGTGESASSSFGVSGADASSVAGGSSSQSIAFEELFRKLYGDAQGAAAGIDTGAISGAAKQLFSGGLDFLGQLGGGAGADALMGRLTDTGARDANLAQLKTGLGELFNEQLLPGITSQGVSTGTLGGARDAVQIGQAAKAVGGQYATGAASILSADQSQRDSAAATLAQITQQGAGTGLGALGSLLGLTQAGETAALTPQQLLASILGGPTVLGESSDFASSLSSSFGRQGSQSYGYDFNSSKTVSSGKGGTQGLAQAFLGAGGATIGFGK